MNKIVLGLAMSLFALPAAAEEPLSWTGLYVGLQGSYVDATKNGHLFYEDFDVMNGESVSLDYEGYMAGVTAGYNWQIGSLVAGLEGDIAFGDVSGEKTYTMPGGAYKWKIESQLDMLATLRARLGFSLGPVLVYGTGGVALATIGSEKEVTSNDGHPWETTALDKADDQHLGFVYGGGAEWALAQGLSLKLEWLHVDLSQEDGVFKGTAYPGKPACTGAPSADCSFAYSSDSFNGDAGLDIIRAGVNYRF